MADTLSPTDPKQAIIDAMLLAEDQLGTTISWAGQEDIPCVCAMESDGKKLDLGGFKLYADTRIKVRTGAFVEGAGLPAFGQTLLYKRSPSADPVKFRIASVERFWDVALLLHCNHPDQGA